MEVMAAADKFRKGNADARLIRKRILMKIGSNLDKEYDALILDHDKNLGGRFNFDRFFVIVWSLCLVVVDGGRTYVSWFETLPCDDAIGCLYE